MGFLDRLFGTDDSQRPAPPVPQNTGYTPRTAGQPGLTPPPAAAPYGSAPSAGAPADGTDDLAIERYRYLLRTAPPQTIEQVHAEAFGRLTEAQRQQVLADLAATLPPGERPATNDPSVMARAATRAEVMNPGFMERSFGGAGGRQGGSFGSMVGGSLLGTVAGYVIGSAIVSSFIAPSFAGDQGDSTGADASADPGGGSDAGADAGADLGGGFDGGGFDAGGFDGGGFDFGF